MVEDISPKRAKVSKKVYKKEIQVERRNVNEKWYMDHKAEFGKLTETYHFTQEMARGAYGVVYEAFILQPESKNPSTKKVAVKAFFQNLYPQLILMELSFLKLIKGLPNIVELLDFMIEKNQFFIITSFYSHVPFEKVMYPEPTYCASMKEIKYYMYSLLEGLETLHSIGVVHRDIKQGNFLYNYHTKKGILIDFGLAEISPEMKEKVKKKKEAIQKIELYQKIIELQVSLGENKIGTEGFMPLEQVLKKGGQSYEVDIWAAGAIFLEFLTSKHTIFKNLQLKKTVCDPKDQKPVEYSISLAYELSCIFGKQNVKDAVAYCDYQIDFPEGLPEHQVSWKEIVKHVEFDKHAEDLLDQMLKLNPKERISAKDALQHPFFSELK